LASEAAKPIDDVRSTADYRKRMCGVLVRRLLTQLAGELG
jgi:CO/xanthine dehydrogenase FAD-binding subunit